MRLSMNQDDFKNLFYSFYSPLCNYALKIIGNKETAEDIVQNLFLQLYERNSLSNVEVPERYLVRCTKYKCLDYLRKKKINHEIDISLIPETTSSDISDLSEEDIEPLIHYFAAKLPPKTREVFLLSRKSGMTYREISEKLDISVKTVETQMGRALRHLKEILKKHNYLSLFFSL